MLFGAAAVRLLFRRSAVASDRTARELCGGFGPHCGLRQLVGPRELVGLTFLRAFVCSLPRAKTLALSVKLCTALEAGNCARS